MSENKTKNAELAAYIDGIRTKALTMFTGTQAPVAAQAVRQGLLSAKENMVLAAAAETQELAQAYSTLAADQVVNAMQVVWKLKHKGVTSEEGAQELILSVAGIVRYMY